MGDTIRQIRLNTLGNTRKSLGRIIRYLQRCDEKELPRYRVMSLYFTNLIATYKLDFENRLEALEKIVNDQK